jgi:predicted RND superfamily exporter protein
MAVTINFGLMGALDIPLDMATATISAMAVGIGADYAVYFLSRVREELGRSGDLDRALATTYETSGKAVVFVSSAVALGYSTLCLSGFAAHVRLGGLVAVAMVSSALATLTILPALLRRLPVPVQSWAPGSAETTSASARPSLER